jgi:hypothetical protein
MSARAARRDVHTLPLFPDLMPSVRGFFEKVESSHQLGLFDRSRPLRRPPAHIGLAAEELNLVWRVVRGMVRRQMTLFAAFRYYDHDDLESEGPFRGFACNTALRPDEGGAFNVRPSGSASTVVGPLSSVPAPRRAGRSGR